MRPILPHVPVQGTEYAMHIRTQAHEFKVLLWFRTDRLKASQCIQFDAAAYSATPRPQRCKQREQFHYLDQISGN